MVVTDLSIYAPVVVTDLSIYFPLVKEDYGCILNNNNDNNNNLYQEDNIFGIYASLTYGPQLQR